MIYSADIIIPCVAAWIRIRHAYSKHRHATILNPIKIIVSVIDYDRDLPHIGRNSHLHVLSIDFRRERLTQFAVFIIAAHASWTSDDIRLLSIVYVFATDELLQFTPDALVVIAILRDYVGHIERFLLHTIITAPVGIWTDMASVISAVGIIVFVEPILLRYIWIPAEIRIAPCTCILVIEMPGNPKRDEVIIAEQKGICLA